MVAVTAFSASRAPASVSTTRALRAAQLTADTCGDHVPVAELVGLGTSGGAAALGMTGRIGTLEPGALADIVLLRTDTVGTAGGHDPFATLLAAHPGIVDTVLVGGRIVKRAGLLTSPRVAGVVADAQRAAARLAHVTGTGAAIRQA